MHIMLYHPDGKKKIWGINCKTIIVDESNAEYYLKDGWYKSPLDFNKPKKATRKKAGKDENKG